MIYSKIENGKIVEKRVVDKEYKQRDPLIVSDGKITTPNSALDFINAGWYLETLPTVTPTTVMTDEVYITGDNSYTFLLRDKTLQELADEAQAQADADELDLEIVDSPLSGVTFTQAATYIENNVTDLASAKTAMKKMAKSILILNKKLGI